MSLSGLHLLITRPEPQAQRWAAKLAALGAVTSISPVMEIEPIEQASCEALAAKQLIADLDLYSAVIFVSQNAVDYGSEWIDNYWPQLPIGVDFVGIGKATQSALLAKGFPVDDELLEANNNDVGSSHQLSASPMNSEALLAQPAFNEVAGQKILIIKGIAGRVHLKEVLESRGAKVDYACLYQRLSAKVFDISQAFIDDTEHKCLITAHSGESIENLLALTPANQKDWLYHHPLLVPGRRVQQLAQNLGFTQVLMAVNATHDSMLEAIYEWQETK